MSSIEFVYSTEVDLSQGSGAAVNERQFVQTLLANHADRVMCVAPSPARPDVFSDSRVAYVYPHRSRPLRFIVYSIALFARICQLNGAHHVKAFAFRLGINPLTPLLLSWLFRKPLFLKTLAGYVIFEKENRGWRTKALAAVLLPLYRATVQHAAVVDTVSTEFVEWAQFRFGVRPDRLHLIRNAADTTAFAPQDRVSCRTALGLDRFRRIVGFAGSFTAEYRLDEMIRCMSQLHVDGLGLVLVGDGPERGALQELAHSLNLDGQVHFTGRVPFSDVTCYINAFDVALDLMIVPMPVNGRLRYSHVTQKTAQYLACGLPVVSYDTPDTRFLNREGIGDVVPIGDVDRLAHAIERCLSMDEEHTGQVRVRARAYVEEHLSNTVVAAKRLALWEAALRSRQPGTGNGSGRTAQ